MKNNIENNKIYGAKVLDLALIIGKNLVISDLHLGYEQALNAEGIMVPRFQYKKIINRLIEILSVADIKKIIINGDLKHEFGKISRQEWNEIMNFIEFLKKHFDKIILIKGNHDHFTRFIAEKSGLEVHENYSVENYLVLHGDKIPDNFEEIKENTLIIGHEHPSIGLRSGERVEKIKCFLKGRWNNKNLIVMPSFNFISEGSDILQEKSISPFLDNACMDDFEVFGVENFEVLYFGKLKDLLKIKDKFKL